MMGRMASPMWVPPMAKNIVTIKPKGKMFKNNFHILHMSRILILIHTCGCSKLQSKAMWWLMTKTLWTCSFLHYEIWYYNSVKGFWENKILTSAFTYLEQTFYKHFEMVKIDEHHHITNLPLPCICVLHHFNNVFKV
jgi:hypothetical protein